MSNLSEISPANQSRLPDRIPDSWIEKIFLKMESRYGSLWADRYGALPRNQVKSDWAEDLAGFTGEELRKGLEACKTLKFPPTLPEFLTLCRPVLDGRAEWAEACEQMRIRLQGEQKDHWSRPEVYWAAVNIGWYDLNSQGWDQIKTRWSNAVANARRDEIPPYRAQLPAPGQQSISREDAEQRVKSLNVTILEGKTDYKAWAKRIIANPKNYPHRSLELAREALGVEA